MGSNDILDNIKPQAKINRCLRMVSFICNCAGEGIKQGFNFFRQNWHTFVMHG